MAPNSPGTITTGLTDLTLVGQDPHRSQLNADLGIVADLSSADATIGSVNVINPPPPPPGAPDAVNDNATTTKGVPVIVDVLKNDKPNKDVAINEDSLATTTSPTKGTATVNADHTITYTPKAGQDGNRLVQIQDLFRTAGSSCGPSVGQAAGRNRARVRHRDGVDRDQRPVGEHDDDDLDDVAVQGSTAAPATTVAPAANTLPRTGSTSGPFTLIGFTLLAAGAALLWSSRRRRTARELTLRDSRRPWPTESEPVLMTMNMFKNARDVREFEPGQIVFKQGEPGDAMYAVVEGRVDITLDGETIETVAEGGIFGELALVDEQTRGATATAAPRAGSR